NGTWASAGALAISFTGLGIAGKNILVGKCAAAGFFRHALMEEMGNLLDLIIGQIERRHAIIGHSAANYFGELFAVLIVGHHNRADQIGPPFAPGRVRAVAESAVLNESLLAEVGLGGIDHGLIHRTGGQASPGPRPPLPPPLP